VAPDPRAPCIIGAARRTWHEQPAPEPLDMWEEVARAADADTGGTSALGSVQSLQVVYCQAWEYDDPCRRLADRLGAEPGEAAYSGLGGSVPVRLVSEAAASMAAGRLDLALVVGGEALATRRHLPDPAWSHPPEEPRPFPISVDRSEARHGIFQAYLTFALLDSARRIHLGRSLADHRQHLGELLAPMTAVAASQPEHAWFPTQRTAEEITTPSSANRMVATPYTKLMTAIMDVDMAAAVLVATEARADELGVPHDRRVYLRGTGGASEPEAMASRPQPWRSPAMQRAMQTALGATSAGDVAHLDLYSCFASSLDFGADALGIDSGRALTVTGGLPYHGGPGSNYGNHALAAMTHVLREDPGSLGLVSGIGMHMTSHSAVLLSTEPGPATTGPVDDGPADSVTVAKEANGSAEVLAYSTVFSREGPEWTALICQLADGDRAYARLEDPVGEDEDLAGATVTLRTGERRVVTAHR
jgi:acetyl-CoA C-acetyltransferase